MEQKNNVFVSVDNKRRRNIKGTDRVMLSTDKNYILRKCNKCHHINI